MKVYPEYQVDISETQGAVDSTNRVVSGELEMGISTSATDYENYYGEGSWEGQPDVYKRQAMTSIKPGSWREWRQGLNKSFFE